MSGVLVVFVRLNLAKKYRLKFSKHQRVEQSLNRQRYICLSQFAEISAAAYNIRGGVHKTPLAKSQTLSAQLGMDLYFKKEFLQDTGSFKVSSFLSLPLCPLRLCPLLGHRSAAPATLCSGWPRTRRSAGWAWSVLSFSLSLPS